jgi:molybdate transport system regulatory protein
MNRLRGTIAAVESNDHLSLVEVDVGATRFTAILLETPQDAEYLAAGRAVTLLFKETEVSLARDLRGQISLRNRFPVTVTAVRRGGILSQVSLDFEGASLQSVVTTRSIAGMAIAAGDRVEALVKSSAMSLTEADGEL